MHDLEIIQKNTRKVLNSNSSFVMISVTRRPSHQVTARKEVNRVTKAEGEALLAAFKLVHNTVGQQVKKRSAKEASVWIESPGYHRFLAEAQKMLGSVGLGDGVPLKQVDYIRVARVEGSQVIHIYPTTDKDPDGIEVKRKNHRVTANLSDTLIAWNLALPVNTRSRFRVQMTTAADPVHPAIKLDLAAPVETETIVRKGKKKSTNQNSQTQPAQTQPAQTQPAGAQKSTSESNAS